MAPINRDATSSAETACRRTASGDREVAVVLVRRNNLIAGNGAPERLVEAMPVQQVDPVGQFRLGQVVFERCQRRQRDGA